MIKFKALNGVIIPYRGRLSVSTINCSKTTKSELDTFRELFGFNKEDDISLCACAIISVRKTPILAIGTYSEDYTLLGGEEADSEEENIPLTKEYKEELAENTASSLEGEIDMLLSYVDSIVLPLIKAYCKAIDDNNEHIIDVRKSFVEECDIFSFFLPNYVYELKEEPSFVSDIVIERCKERYHKRINSTAIKKYTERFEKNA